MADALLLKNVVREENNMSEIKKLAKPVWTGFSVNKSGKQIIRMMTAKEAQDWALKTGKPVFQSMKAYELRNL